MSAGEFGGVIGQGILYVLVKIEMSQICVYFQTWSSGWAADVSGLDLARVDAGITILNLAFVLPKCTYFPGQRTWDVTGLQFSSDFGVVVAGIASLRKKGMKVSEANRFLRIGMRNVVTNVLTIKLGDVVCGRRKLLV